jgi:hypothetical protein
VVIGERTRIRGGIRGLALGIWLVAAASARAAGREGVSIRIETDRVVAGADSGACSQNVVRAPDGALWLNSTTTRPGLFRSTDDGATWTTQPIELPGTPAGQYLAGLHAGRDGRLWIIHQAAPAAGGETDRGRPAFVSISGDRGRTWTTRRIDFARFAPGGTADPYVSIDIAWCHPNFVERPDGTVMFSASMRYEQWNDYLARDPSRPGIRDVMVRTRDGGETWGDPTVVHQHATETAYAVDPRDPDHILAPTRILRKALPGEDPLAVLRRTAVPYPPGGFVYKNGLLLESRDGGRSFQELPAGLVGFASYRWSALWTRENRVILTSIAGRDPGAPKVDQDHVARISLDGGRTWLDGTSSGSERFDRARKFPIVRALPDIGKADHYSDCVPATVQLAPNRFLTFYRYKRDRVLRSRVWRLENLP